MTSQATNKVTRALTASITSRGNKHQSNTYGRRVHRKRNTIPQDLDTNHRARELITCTAGGGRVLLQVLQLLQDPLRRHRSNPKQIPQNPQIKSNLGYGSTDRTNRIKRGGSAYRSVPGGIRRGWRGIGAAAASLSSPRRAAATACRGGSGHKREEARSRGIWLGCVRGVVL